MQFAKKFSKERLMTDKMTRRSMIKAASLGVMGTGAALLAGGCTGSSTDSTAEAGEASSGYETFWLYNPSGYTASGASVDSKLLASMKREGISRPYLAGGSDAKVESLLTDDLYPDVNELFYLRGWTDGLPIVPPIEQNVISMCKGTDLSRQTQLGTLAPLSGIATVENVAANAVMAGCGPTVLPFLISAVQAVSDPEFDLVSVSTTTSPNATLICVNGPAALRAGINAGANALGRGWRANATLGRALHLVEQNVGGSWPRISDYSTIGMPGDFSLCLAENEAENPWDTFASERGFGPGDNVVTVASAESVMLIVDIGITPVGFLKRVANVIAGRDRVNAYYLLVMTPSTAKRLFDEGWNKDDIRSYINDYARIPSARLEETFTSVGRDGERPTDYTTLASEPDENGLVAMPFIKELHIIVAGGIGEKNALIPLWGSPVSRTVDLPKDWEALLAIQMEKAQEAGAEFKTGESIEGVSLSQ